MTVELWPCAEAEETLLFGTSKQVHPNIGVVECFFKTGSTKSLLVKRPSKIELHSMCR